MFETLGKKLTDFGNVAAKKTKDLGNTVSLTAKIEATKRELTGVYAQLGQLVYQNLQENIPEEYTELFDKITRTEATLDDYQAQRQVLRKVRPCPNCGEDVSNDAEFCSKCGSHVGAISPEPEADDADLFEEDIPADDVQDEAPVEEEKPAEEE